MLLSSILFFCACACSDTIAKNHRLRRILEQGKISSVKTSSKLRSKINNNKTDRVSAGGGRMNCERKPSAKLLRTISFKAHSPLSGIQLSLSSSVPTLASSYLLSLQKPIYP